jgi:histidinol-phosphatase
VPVWATLIALFVGDEITTGVVSAPALGRRWWAATGRGAHTSVFGGPPPVCRVSGVADLADASLSYSEPGEWQQAGTLEQFLQLQRACWRTRAYGDFWSYVLVADGAVDVAAEPDLSLWDLAALVPIVTEAGGRFTDVRGATVDWSTTSAVATNGLLHERTVGLLTGS